MEPVTLDDFIAGLEELRSSLGGDTEVLALGDDGEAVPPVAEEMWLDGAAGLDEDGGLVGEKTTVLVIVPWAEVDDGGEEEEEPV
jgi:hypothetical protein